MRVRVGMRVVSSSRVQGQDEGVYRPPRREPVVVVDPAMVVEAGVEVGA